MGRSPYTNFLGHLRKHDEDIIAEAMNMVGVTHLAERRVETLSDGERQKAMIAKALAQQTPVIMLDEPTAFLDFNSRVQLFRLLQRLAHDTGKAILVSTHDLELVLQLADKVWLIQDKKMHTGEVKELAANGTLKRFIEGEGIAYNATENRIEIIKTGKL
jgi:iron complex transport system ATP-binding protein